MSQLITNRDIPALQVRGLTVTISLRRGRTATLLDEVSWSVMPGRTVGIVGESGSGKTMASLAVMGLLPRNAAITGGEVLLNGQNLVGMSQGEMRQHRGSEIGLVPQDPFSSLDPSFSIGNQLTEAFKLHTRLRGKALAQALIASLERVRIPSATDRLRQYPHQLSGGMLQRVVSAIALAGKPKVLIADEPTTALDVTTQAQYLLLLGELQRTTGFALVLISHDLLLVRNMCERVVVMYAGQVVEEGSLSEVFDRPLHPYSRALIGAIPMIASAGRLEAIEGKTPDPGDLLPRCHFAPRCKYARTICFSSPPKLSQRGETGRSARCWGTEPDGWIAP
jgi:oligopeptide/dipeptide ABC transporter ATP-binding protein